MEPPDDLSDSKYTPAGPPAAAPAALKQSTLAFAPTSLLSASAALQESLPSLNPAQRDAVTWAKEGGLAVHAGPGSGKTKVLTTRVAWLVLEAGVKPEELVVVTFTNKAASEMRVRLSKILGPATTDKVVLGTFHSVCVRYLRKYASLVGLVSNFLITDRDDCLAIIKRLLLSPSVPSTLKREMKPPQWLEAISRCKARLINPDQYRAEKMSGNGPVSPAEEEKIEAIAGVYEAYEEELRKANALDFDDLLVRGHELFSRHPRVVGKIQSVLIDEFQDTNTVQYDLVKLIARASGSLTIVGDPDQSIYGWRNAEIENLEKMLKDFQPVKQIFLEQNYRSTGAILGAALAVVRQDTKRINKSLLTSHPTGSSVVLHHAPSAQDEAQFIAHQIKHLIAHLGGLVSYNDCAVLLRYGALSRAVETAFQRSGVPSRMVGGHKFFERAEIKDLLSYLQLSSNPSYTPALLRVLNTPRRGLGDKTIREIAAAGERKGISAFEVCVKLANGAEGLGLVKGLTGAQRKGVKGFVEVVAAVRKAADEGADVADLIDLICEKTGYREYLERTQSVDWAERWENVKELKSYATIVASENPPADLATALDAAADAVAAGGAEGDSQFEEVTIPAAVPPAPANAGQGSDDDIEIVEPAADDDAGDDEEEKVEMPLASQAAAAPGQTTPLETFLATSMLATDTDTEEAKKDGKADGLEWPIVFIPAVEAGTYPFFRSTEANEVDEERRLLYVAITRAQGFCFLSYANSRMAGAEMKTKELSPFLSNVAQQYPTLFVKKLQKVAKKTREETAAVLGREKPDEEEVKRLVEEYNATQPVEPAIFDPKKHGSSAGSRNYSSYGRYGSGGPGGFSSGPFASSSQSQGRYGGASSGFTTGAGGSLGRWSNMPSASQPAPQTVPAGEGGFRSALAGFKAQAAGVGVTVTTNGFEDLMDPPSSSAPPALKPSNPYAAAAAAAAAKPNPWRAGARNLAASSSSSSLPMPSSSAPAASTSTGLPPPPRANAFKPPGFRPPAMMNPTVPGPPSSASTALPLPPFSRPAPLPSSAPAAEGPPDIVETRSSMIRDAVLVNPKLSQPGPSKGKDLLASFQSGAQGELDAFKMLGAGAAEKGKGKPQEIVLTSSDTAEEDPLPQAGVQHEEDDLPNPALVGRAALPPQSPRRSARTKGKRAAPAAAKKGGAKKAKK
ncbi:ATP-dependent DNA helicase srs2 [Rhodosporidiobolus nylandii]